MPFFTASGWRSQGRSTLCASPFSNNARRVASSQEIRIPVPETLAVRRASSCRRVQSESTARACVPHSGTSRIRHGGREAFHAKDHLVVVDDFHLLHGASEIGQGGGGILTGHKRVGMSHIPGGKLAIPEVKGDTLAQQECPFGEIGVGLPLLGQMRDKGTGFGVNV
jgi:hypothetical protein